MVSFNQIPANIRSPLAYIEVNASNQNANQPTNKRILVIGQRKSSGTIAANTPVLVSNYAQAVTYFGQGSMLANMFEKLFLNNSFTEKWALPVDDDAAGTAATGTIAVTGPATASGTLSLYLGGVLVSVSVANTDTATEIGDAIVAAIDANDDLPISASNSSGTVTVTYAHKGVVGNYFPMYYNYGGAQANEALPAGVGVTITQMASGATDPTLTTALSGLPEKIFDYWVHPYQGTTPLNALDTELDSRWSGLRMLEGHAFGAAAGTVGALVSIGNGRNNPHMTILDAGENSPSPSYLWASAATGLIASSASIDPARPFTTLQMTGILPPPVADRRTLSDKNSLLYDGIATHDITDDGKVQLERIITTYQTNGSGIADGVYLDANTPLTLSYLRQSLRQRITTKFARMKLADNGTRFGAGQAIVTPNIISSEIVAWASQMSVAGLIEDMEDFKANLIVERDENDPTRVNVNLTPNLVNQFYIFAASISFIL
jgi:phage tail sheath gpL-like